jgi:Amt family ammonium transporter
MAVSLAFNVVHGLGLLFVLIMTVHSINRARDGYSPVSHWNKNSSDSAYIVPCSWEMDVIGQDGEMTTKKIFGINHGDTALMMFGTTLVMFQTPAMGVAQAGMIRRKNSLSMMMQCTSGMAIGSLLWYVIGYSLTFGPDIGGFIGDPWPFLFFRDMPRSETECLAIAPSIPGPLFASFQMMFALMTPVIVTGAWAEKLKMEAFVLFMVFWPILVYYPIAHWIWGGGWMYKMGCIDFAGGITIHTTAGVAAMVISLMLKPRRNVERLAMTHHNISLLVIGGTIVWAGWYSFNGCSALVGGASAGAALLNTHISASVSGLTWVLLTYRRDGCFHVTDMFNGAFAGLAGVTPGSGWIPSQAAFCYGIIIGSASWNSCGFFKNRLKIDDVLDVFSLQAVPGAIGSILCGIFAGGEPFGIEGEDNLGLAWGGNGKLLGVQIFCVLVAAAETAVATYILMKCIEKTVGLELTVQEEDEGLDKSQIGEIGYDYTSPMDSLTLDEGELATHMIEAAANGNLAQCKRLVQTGASIYRGDYDKRTAMHLAAAEGRLAVCKWLISEVKGVGAEQIVNVVDSFGCTPVQGAMENGHLDIVALLKKHGGRVEDSSKYVFMLCQTAASGNVAKLKSLVEKQGLDVNLSDYDQRTPLHVAAAAGRAAATAYLLTQSASPGAKDRWGQTPLDSAAVGACTTILTYPDKDWTNALRNRDWSGEYRQGLDQEALANDGESKPTGDAGGHSNTAAATKELLDAAAAGNLKLVKTLTTRGVDCSTGDYDRRTALHIACTNGHQQMVKYLLRQKSVVVNCVDRFDISPLDEASRRKYAGIVELLKKHGATSLTASSGFTLCTAAASNSQAKLESLQMSGVDLSAADYDGRTALHLAVSEGHTGIVLWLLQTGDCAVNVVDRMHHTPLDDALNSAGAQKIELEEAIRAAGGSTGAELTGGPR